MNRDQKTQWANSFKEKLTKANLAVFADYRGLKSNDADILRRKLREKGAEVKVLKNNIARLAVKDGAFGEDAKRLMDTVVGPTLVAFSYKDPVAVAKLVHEFAKENEVFVLKESLFERRTIKAPDIEALAKLPAREILLSMLLSILNGPARGLVSVMAAVPRGLVTVLAAIEKKKSESN